MLADQVDTLNDSPVSGSEYLEDAALPALVFPCIYKNRIAFLYM
jgi:hypothetical protein